VQVRPSFWARTRAPRAAGAFFHAKGTPAAGWQCTCCEVAAATLRARAAAVAVHRVGRFYRNTCACCARLSAPRGRTRECLSRRLHMPWRPSAARRAQAAGGAGRARDGGRLGRGAVRRRAPRHAHVCAARGPPAGAAPRRPAGLPAAAAPRRLRAVRAHAAGARPAAPRCRPVRAGRAPVEAARAARGGRLSPALKRASVSDGGRAAVPLELRLPGGGPAKRAMRRPPARGAARPRTAVPHAAARAA